MMNFCTLFDSYYILKGLALYQSLEDVSDDFHLYVMAFDKECHDKLKALNYRHMTVELVDDFETPELLEAKKDRTKAEYCWTCGPAVIWHFMKKYALSDITYLDSDLFFLGDPKIAFDEIGDNSIAITKQGISKKSEELYGKYCVQFMFFRNDEEGCKALAWWRDSCIDWCYQRFEEGKYADQKYLDQFPVKFSKLCVMKNLGVGVAPWNMHRYGYKKDAITYEGKDYPVVFVHMHGLKFNIKDTKLSICSYDDIITEKDKEFFYNPYASVLVNLLNGIYGKGIKEYEISGISGTRRFYYKLRAALRDVKFIQYLYFKVFKRTYQGHGTIVE
jgi:hypothetical protein